MRIKDGKTIDQLVVEVRSGLLELDELPTGARHAVSTVIDALVAAEEKKAKAAKAKKKKEKK